MSDEFTFEIIAFGILILAYLTLYYLSTFLIKNELQKKKTKQISKTKTLKIIKRKGEDFEYEFPLNPNLEEFWLRLIVKVLDYGFYLSVFYVIDTFLFKDYFNPYLFSFLALFIINPIFECLTGKTFGKYIFGMRVIDDFGDNPSLITSLIKGILQLFSIPLFVLSSGTIMEDEMFFHNKRTLTYTIWEKDREKILAELIS